MAEAADDQERINKPAAGNTLPLNIIEHDGEFPIACPFGAPPSSASVCP